MKTIQFLLGTVGILTIPLCIFHFFNDGYLRHISKMIEVKIILRSYKLFQRVDMIIINYWWRLLSYYQAASSFEWFFIIFFTFFIFGSKEYNKDLQWTLRDVPWIYNHLLNCSINKQCYITLQGTSFLTSPLTFSFCLINFFTIINILC